MPPARVGGRHTSSWGGSPDSDGRVRAVVPDPPGHASAAAVLLSAGAKGKRFALPNARILIHQPALVGGDYGQASDIEIQANEVLRMRTWLEETWAEHSGRTPEQVRNDIERDKILSAAEAKEYGLIDEVLASRKGTLED